MNYTRSLLKKDRLKLDHKHKEVMADLYYYRDMEVYLSPEDRKRKTDRLQSRAGYLKEYMEEIDFLLDLMDQAGIDKFFRKSKEAPVHEYI